MAKQHEIVAIEADFKKRAKKTQTELYKFVQKADLFNGLNREYRPLQDDGEKLPAESRRIQRDLKDDIKEFDKVTVRLLDLMATKDQTNTNAFANLEVDGQVLAENIPVTTLLTLEKELHHIRSFYEKLPTLPLDTTWTKDEASGQFIAPEVETTRTKKTQRPIVLYDATPEHPAQTQLISEDIQVGIWQTRKLSTSMPAPKKQQLLDRIDALLDGTKKARERANGVEVTEKKIGKAIFDFIHG